MAYRHPLILYGTIIAISHSTVPTGYLLCNGSAVSRTTYANLFKAIGSTYGSGDGSSTFNLPNLVGRFLEGDNSAGILKVAGLPNITGSYINYRASIQEATGAIANDGGVSPGGRHDTAQSGSKVSFNASRCSSIYGASTTVQPPAVTTLFCIKY